MIEYHSGLDSYSSVILCSWSSCSMNGVITRSTVGSVLDSLTMSRLTYSYSSSRCLESCLDGLKVADPTWLECPSSSNMDKVSSLENPIFYDVSGYESPSLEMWLLLDFYFGSFGGLSVTFANAPQGTSFWCWGFLLERITLSWYLELWTTDNLLLLLGDCKELFLSPIFASVWPLFSTFSLV